MYGNKIKCYKNNKIITKRKLSKRKRIKIKLK